MLHNVVLLFPLFLYASTVCAHVAPYAKGMYCKNGFKDGKKLTGNDALNSNTPVNPLYQLPFNDWWFHGQCRNDPPPDGEFLELPAGGSFQVEIASNRGKTSLSFDGKFTSEWPDGGNYPEDYHVDSCITSPNLHAQNQNSAAGTAFAISYESDMSKVTPENLVVFSVRYHTPFKRVASYDVPKKMPKCPEGGCICAWGWVPNGCGQPNMYHTGFRCKVTGATSTTAIGTPKPPVWCQDDPSKCVKGPKQMIYWHQAERNNIEVSGYDKSGAQKSPAYNGNCGFSEGPQNDIFTGSAGSGSSSDSNNGSSNNGSSNNGSSNNGSSNNGSSGNGSNSNPQSSSSAATAASTPQGSSGKCSKRARRRSLDAAALHAHRRHMALSRISHD